MFEFYLSVQGEPIRGPMELDEALGAMCRLNARLSMRGCEEPHCNPDNRGYLMYCLGALGKLQGSIVSCRHYQ